MVTLPSATGISFGRDNRCLVSAVAFLQSCNSVFRFGLRAEFLAPEELAPASKCCPGGPKLRPVLDVAKTEAADGNATMDGFRCVLAAVAEDDREDLRKISAGWAAGPSELHRGIFVDGALAGAVKIVAGPAGGGSLSIFLAADATGRGIGTWAVCAALELYAETSPEAEVYVDLCDNNYPMEQIARKLGDRRASIAEGGRFRRYLLRA